MIEWIVAAGFGIGIVKYISKQLAIKKILSNEKSLKNAIKDFESLKSDKNFFNYRKLEAWLLKYKKIVQVLQKIEPSHINCLTNNYTRFYLFDKYIYYYVLLFLKMFYKVHLLKPYYFVN